MKLSLAILATTAAAVLALEAPSATPSVAISSSTPSPSSTPSSDVCSSHPL